MAEHEYDRVLSQLDSYKIIPQGLIDEITDDVLFDLTSSLLENEELILQIINLLSDASRTFCNQLLKKCPDSISLIVSKLQSTTDCPGLEIVCTRLNILANLVDCDEEVFAKYVGIHALSTLSAEIRSVPKHWSVSEHLAENISNLMQMTLNNTQFDDGSVVQDYLEVITDGILMTSSSGRIGDLVSCLEKVEHFCNGKMDVIQFMNRKKKLMSRMFVILGSREYTDRLVVEFLHRMICDSSYCLEKFPVTSGKHWSHYVSGKLYPWRLQVCDESSLQETVFLLQMDNMMLKKHAELISNFIGNKRPVFTVKVLKQIPSCQNILSEDLGLYDLSLAISSMMRKCHCDGGISRDLVKLIGDHVGDKNRLFMDVQKANAECLYSVINLSENHVVRDFLAIGLLDGICKMIKIKKRNGLFIVRNRQDMLQKWLQVVNVVLKPALQENFVNEDDEQLLRLTKCLIKVTKSVNTSEKCLKLIGQSGLNI